jgi:predicted MFS family arabinose efflux permease
VPQLRRPSPTADRPPTRGTVGPLEGHSLRLTMLLLAVSCGAAVANIYYAQPLLGEIAHSFAISHGTASLVVTATQVGYAFGLAFLLPIGDLIPARRLVSGLLVGTAATLLIACLAPGFRILLAAFVVLGLTSIVAQILMPLAARLAPAEERGRWMGTVTSGLLVGIMLARSLSSFAAAAWGWQSIYVISAGLMLVLSVALRFLLPPAEPLYRASYGSLIRSTVELARSEPILRRRSLAQALMFGTFTTFWTAIAYELASRHGLDQTEIAVFALVGAAGALSAPLIGRLGDSGHGAVGRFVGFALAIAAMTLAALGASSVALLVTAAVVLDVGAQFNYVLSMRDIYELAPDARARINSVFMTTMFLGGAVASALTGVISDRWGWSGVCVFGIVEATLGVLVWITAPYDLRTDVCDPNPGGLGRFHRAPPGRTTSSL